MAPETSGVMDAQRVAEHVSHEHGDRNRSALQCRQRARGENGLETWRRFAQRFDAASAQANPSLMHNRLKPPRGEIANTSFFIGMVCWDERTGRQALTNDTREGRSSSTCALSIWGEGQVGH